MRVLWTSPYPYPEYYSTLRGKRSLTVEDQEVNGPQPSSCGQGSGPMCDLSFCCGYYPCKLSRINFLTLKAIHSTALRPTENRACCFCVLTYILAHSYDYESVTCPERGPVSVTEDMVMRDAWLQGVKLGCLEWRHQKWSEIKR